MARSQITGVPAFQALLGSMMRLQDSIIYIYFQRNSLTLTGKMKRLEKKSML